MHIPNRRAFMRNFSKFAAGAALLSVAACGAVTVTNTGGVAQVNLNMSELDTYGQAVISGITTLMSIPGLSALLGAGAATVPLILADISTQLKALDAAANGSLTLSFSVASPLAAWSALLSDNAKVLALAKAGVTAMGGSATSAVITLLNAVQTVVTVMQAWAGTAGAKMKDLPMSIGSALSVIQAAPKAKLI